MRTLIRQRKRKSCFIRENIVLHAEIFRQRRRCVKIALIVQKIHDTDRPFLNEGNCKGLADGLRRKHSPESKFPARRCEQAIDRGQHRLIDAGISHQILSYIKPSAEALGKYQHSLRLLSELSCGFELKFFSRDIA